MNITLFEVEEIIRAINKFDAQGDFVRAHSEEDRLLQRLVRAVCEASSDKDAKKLKAMAMKINDQMIHANVNEKRYFWNLQQNPQKTQ